MNKTIRILKRSSIFIFLLLISLFLSCARSKSVIQSIYYTNEIKDTYLLNEALDDINLYAKYKDKDEKITEFEISNYDTSTLGEHNVTITYLSFTLNFKFTVISNENKLVINEYPIQNVFGEDSIDLSSLVVSYDNNIITDYEITSNINEVTYHSGVKEVTFQITYEGKHTSFIINVYKDLNIYTNRCNYSLISEDSITNKIDNVHNGGWRAANYIVYYNEINYQTTNIYGYEFGIDKYGLVITQGVNVDIPKGGFILSGHGEGKTLLMENLKIGDRVFYSDVFKCAFILSNNPKYDLLDYANALEKEINSFRDNLLKYSNIKDDTIQRCYSEYKGIVEEYNSYMSNLNGIVKANLDNINDSNLSTLLSEAQNEYYKIKNKLDSLNVKEVNQELMALSYVPNSLDFDALNEIVQRNKDRVYLYTISIDHEDHFRQSNELVYYDESSKSSRNEFGYEVAVSSEGLVIDMAINCKIPKGGYVLSGNSIGADTLKDKIKLGDYIEYDHYTLKAKVYRNFSAFLFTNYKNEINEAINAFYETYESKNLVYLKSAKDYIDKAINIYNIIVKMYNNKDIMRIITENTSSDIDRYLMYAYFLLSEELPVQNHAIWHSPNALKSLFNEETYEGVNDFTTYLKDLGFTRLYVNITGYGYAYYASTYYIPRAIYSEPYNEYKDYLECLCALAHQKGIEIIPWVQTVKGHDPSATVIPSCYKEEWFTKDFKGNHNNYLDTMNPEVREFLINAYTELALNYDLDGIEYDYIRYEWGNLYNHSNTNGLIDYGYTDYAMNAFLEENNLTGDLHKLLFSEPGLKSKWIEYKKDSITEILRGTKESISKFKPDFLFSAAVFSSPGSINAVMQDWPTWFEEGLVDYLDPMLYTEGLSSFVKTVENWMTTLPYAKDTDNILIQTGIGPIVDGEDYLDYPKQIAYTSSKGHSYSIFSTSISINNIYIREIMKVLNKSISTESKTSDKIDATCKYMINGINNYYMKISDYNFDTLLTSLNELMEIEDPCTKECECKMNEILAEIDKIDDEKIKECLYRYFILCM